MLALPVLLAAVPAGAAVRFSVTDLGTLGGTFSGVSSVNDARQVVGYAYTSGDASYRAFLWQSDRMQDVGTLGGKSSQAFGIDAAGRIVGSASTSDANHAFLWQSGRMQDLGTLGGTNSRAYDIDATGRALSTAERQPYKGGVCRAARGELHWRSRPPAAPPSARQDSQAVGRRVQRGRGRNALRR